MWKDWVRPFVRPLPQWSIVAVASPQKVVAATMRWDGNAVDVTTDHTVASLMPLVIATSLDAGPHPVLEYSDRATGKRLGILRLAYRAPITVEGTTLSLYNVIAGDHCCLSWPRRRWNAWLQSRAMSKSRAPHHLAMEPNAVQQLMIAYLCPRPVVLVSVDALGHQNIFPMDLIGPLARSGFYSLGLRSTNVSEPVMRDVKRVVLSNMPASMKTAVYQLSEHHKQPLADWSALPLAVKPSKAFGIPGVAAATRVQELSIAHSQVVGSHTFFVCRIVGDQNGEESPQLHHTAGFHQVYRRGKGVPFTEI